MKNKRPLQGILLAVILTLLILYSSLEHNNHDPNIEYILENFETYNNTKLSFTGVIEEVNETNQQIVISILRTPYLMEIKFGTNVTSLY